jgi:hypothetical protein
MGILNEDLRKLMSCSSELIKPTMTISPEHFFMILSTMSRTFVGKQQQIIHNGSFAADTNGPSS